MFHKMKLGLVFATLAAVGCAGNTDDAGNPQPQGVAPTAPASIPADDDPAEAPEDPFSPLGGTDAEDEATDGALDFNDVDDDVKLPAELDQPQAGVKKNTDTYTRTGWRYVGDLQACLKYTFTGKLTYTSERIEMMGGQVAWRLRHITLAAPKTTTQLYRYDPGSHACTTREMKVDKLTVSNAYSGYSCSWNPQISVGLPFSVAFGFWPSCGNRKAARYTGSVSHNDGMIQSNPDTRIHFKDQVKFNQGGAPPKFGCYGSALKASITNGRNVVSVKSPRRKLCLSPVW